MSSTVQDLASIRAAGTALIEAPQPLPPELLPVEPFPMVALPDAFGPWVCDVSERMHCPLTLWQCRYLWPVLRWWRAMSASDRSGAPTGSNGAIFGR